ncbi:MAG: hypothetical protein QXD08_05450 [Pyrobaculum sp.]
MDPVAAYVLTLLAYEEARGGVGATRYRVMRLLNQYPNYVYRTIDRLEKEGYVECLGGGRGRRCRATLLALFKLYTSGSTVAERLIAKRLGVESIDDLKTVLREVAKTNYAPRNAIDLTGWLVVNAEMPEARRLLIEIAPGLRHHICGDS